MKGLSCSVCINQTYFFVSTDKLAFSLETELRRLQKRRLFTSEDLPHHSNTNNTLMGSGGGLSGGGRGREQPLFTLRQVVMVCQRKLKQREDELREEYDKVLSTKLAGVCIHCHPTCTVHFIYIRTYVLV